MNTTLSLEMTKIISDTYRDVELTTDPYIPRNIVDVYLKISNNMGPLRNLVRNQMLRASKDLKVLAIVLQAFVYIGTYYKFEDALVNSISDVDVKEFFIEIFELHADSKDSPKIKLPKRIETLLSIFSVIFKNYLMHKLSKTSKDTKRDITEDQFNIIVTQANAKIEKINVHQVSQKSSVESLTGLFTKLATDNAAGKEVSFDELNDKYTKINGDFKGLNIYINNDKLPEDEKQSQSLSSSHESIYNIQEHELDTTLSKKSSICGSYENIYPLFIEDENLNQSETESDDSFSNQSSRRGSCNIYPLLDDFEKKSIKKSSEERSIEDEIPYKRTKIESEKKPSRENSINIHDDKIVTPESFISFKQQHQ